MLDCDDVSSVHVPDEVKVLDMAVEPSRYIPKMIKKTWWFAQGVCISTLMFTCASIVCATKSIANGATNMFDSLAIKTDRKRTIMDDKSNTPYLLRYYLLWRNRPSWFPFNIFVNKYVISDSCELHDHPWDFFTVILRGGHWEHVFVDNNNKETLRVWRTAGYYQLVHAECARRIELDETAGPCWTLCIPFCRWRPWGYYRRLEGGNESTRWMDYEHYFRLRKTIREQMKNGGNDDTAVEENDEANDEANDELNDELSDEDPMAMTLSGN